MITIEILNKLTWEDIKLITDTDNELYSRKYRIKPIESAEKYYTEVLNQIKIKVISENKITEEVKKNSKIIA